MKLRLTILALTTIALAAIAGGTYAYYNALQAAVLANAEGHMAADTGAIANRMATAVSEHLKTARTLAGLPAMREALSQPTADRIRAANQILAHFQQNLQVSVCYLMDTRGLTIAASNVGRPDSFVGHNYAFRPYFQKAMQGLSAVHLAVGVTSGIRGIYSGHPVLSADDAPGDPLGVVVIKSAIGALESEIRQTFANDWVLADPGGRIFAASRPQWRQGLVWPQPGAADAVGAHSDANGDTGDPWIGMRRLSNGRAADRAGREYLVYTAALPGFPEWQIHTFCDRAKVLSVLESPLLNERLAELVILCFVFASMIVALYAVAREDMRQRQTIHAALQRHNAYMEALHETTLGLVGRMKFDELIEAVLNRAGALAGTRNGFLILYNDDEKILELKVGLGLFHNAVGLRIQPGKGLAGQIFVTGRPLVIPDYAKWEGRLEDHHFDGLHAVMGIPLKSGDQFAGVIGLGHRGAEKSFGEEEQDALIRLAELATIVLDNARLYDRLQRELKERRRAQEALKEASEKLRRLAMTDQLTQVANRRLFDERLDIEWRRMRRERQPLSLLICDVDHFKAYNDTNGHLAGDDCLRTVAGTIRANVRRPGDLVARYGGEEFAVILSRTDAPGARHVAERIRRAVEALGIVHSTSPIAGYVTISLGSACSLCDEQITGKKIIETADRALYEAKRAGRNRVVVYG
jgi:diguanylate cyclase (GGDEF)-like protein